MLCERAQELFSDYHEGSVKPAMLVPFESHLHECADCRTRLDGVRDVWEMLDSAPYVEPPVGFHAAVWARIDAMEAEKARNRRRVVSSSDSRCPLDGEPLVSMESLLFLARGEPTKIWPAAVDDQRWAEVGRSGGNEQLDLREAGADQDRGLGCFTSHYSGACRIDDPVRSRARARRAGSAARYMAGKRRTKVGGIVSRPIA
jgi:hypothetical protein